MQNMKSILSMGMLALFVVACGNNSNNHGSDANTSDAGASDAGDMVDAGDADGGTTDGGTGVGHVKACLFENGTLGNCSLDGLPIHISFGAIPISAGTRTIKLISDGTADAVVSSFTLNGDTEFTVSPASADYQSTTLAPGDELTFVAGFASAAAGARVGRLTFTTNDAQNPSLIVDLDAVGDDARLCACHVDGASCVPTTALDFGDVPLTQTKSEVLRLSACGTQPVKLNEVQFVSGSPLFAVNGFPMSNTTLQPGGSPLELQVSYTPFLAQPDTGRLSIVTATRHLDIDLTGNGIDVRCRLSATPMSVDFGSIAATTTSTEDIVLTNVGERECRFPSAAGISLGNLRFAVVSSPSQPLAVGATTTLKVSYTPASTTAADVGQLVVPFGDDLQPLLGSVVIELTGTPIPTPVCKLKVQPGLTASSRILDFGMVVPNTTKVVPVTLTNVGTLDCYVNGASLVTGVLASFQGLTTAPYQIVSPPPSGPIAPGMTATVEVSFTPPGEGNFANPNGAGSSPAYGVSLLVKTTDTGDYNGQECGSAGGNVEAGCISWEIAAKGGRSLLVALPSAVDFGEVSVGCRSVERSVTLYNLGTVAANIKSIRIDPPTPSGQTSDFTMIPPPVPFSLGAGALKKIPILFRPSAVGSDDARLLIEHDLPSPMVTEVPLNGVGTSATQKTETFTQALTKKNDILFVINNSTTMGQEQSQLSSNVQAFVDALNLSSVDGHISIVTADVSDSTTAGRFRGTKISLTPGNAASTLPTTINSLGAGGPPNPQGLWAMYLALSNPLINDATANAGFLRTDARLSVIVLSDKDDASAGSTDFYEQFLWSVKGRNRVSLSAVVGDASTGCSGMNGTATAGTRFLDVQQATSGVFQSVCAPNWTQVAQGIGLTATTLPNSFQLSRVADVATLAVTVNSAASPAANWAWDAANNAIVFNSGAVPAAGATVGVTYNATCH